MGQIVSDVESVLEYKKSAKQAKSERKKILEQMAADSAAKTNLVKKNLAAQRAKYGAAGMRGDGITEGAVLKRIQSETEEPFQEKRRTNLDKLKSIKTTRPNLLKTLLSRFDDLVG